MQAGGDYVFQCDGTIGLAYGITIGSHLSLDATGHNVTLQPQSPGAFISLTPFIEVTGGSLSLTHLTLNAWEVGGPSDQSLKQGTNGTDGTPGADAPDNNSNGGNGASGTPGGAGPPGGDRTTPVQGGALKIDSGTVVLTADTFTANMVFGSSGDSGGFGGNGGNGGGGGNGGAFGVGGNGADGAAGGDGGKGGHGSNAEGGAIYNAGDLTITGSTFTSNGATGGSGGPSGFGGDGGIGGSAGRSGDGIIAQGSAGAGGTSGSSGPAGNAGDGEGGAIYNAGTLNLTGTTFSSNVASGGPGGPSDPPGLAGSGAMGGNGGSGGAGGAGGVGRGGGLFDAGSSTLSADSFTSNSAQGGNGGDGAAGARQGSAAGVGGDGGRGGDGGDAQGGALAGNAQASGSVSCSGNSATAGAGGAGGASGVFGGAPAADGNPGIATDPGATFCSGPIIDSVSPVGGPLAGGNMVKIMGSGFAAPSLTFQGVTFGGTLAGVAPTVVSDTEIDVTAPDATVTAGSASRLVTEVTAEFETSGAAADNSTPAAPGDNTYVFGTPVVDSVVPVAGPLVGGNVVKITGSGFENPELTFDGVSFDPAGDTNGSKAFSGLNPEVVSDTEVDVTAPDATTAADGAATLDTTVSVTFEVTADSSTEASVPAAPGDNAYQFGTPVIDAVEPGAGPLAGGDLIKITGTNLESPDLALVTVVFDLGGGTTVDGVTPVVVSDTEVDVTAPDVTADAAGKTSVNATVTLHYTVTGSVDGATEDSRPEVAGVNAYVFGAPVIDAIEPSAGPLAGGNRVKITGSGFENPDLSLHGVAFDPLTDTDGSQAMTGVSPVVVSDTEVDVTAPDATAAAAGSPNIDSTVTILFDLTDGSSIDDSVPAKAGDNAYAFGTPTIDSVQPTAGPLEGGNLVKIIGTNFGNAGLTLATVTFDMAGGAALAGLDPVVVSDTEVDVTAPDATIDAAGHALDVGAITVRFDVVGSTDGATVDSQPNAAGDNDYFFGAPVVDAIDPVGGPLAGGNLLKITGSGFENPDLTFSTVTFDPAGDVGGAHALDGVSPVVVSDTEVDVTAPDATIAAGRVAQPRHDRHRRLRRHRLVDRREGQQPAGQSR